MTTDVTQSMWVYDFWAWLLANRKRLLGVAIALGVVGAAAAIMNQQRHERELTASNALIALQIKRDSKPTAADYAKVTEEFKGTVAAERALMLAAAALFTEGKYADAKTKFSDYLATHADGPFRATAMMGVAACEDGANEVDKAAASYQQVISVYPNEPIAAQAKMALALLMEAKDVSKAYKLYEEVAKIQGSSFSGMAREKQQQLQEKHPELTPTATSASQLPIGIGAPPMVPKAK